MSNESVSYLSGSEAVVEWFGYWPSFHDAKVLELCVKHRGISTLRLHAWNISDKRYEKDGMQFIVLDKHAVVTFEMEGEVRVELGGLDNRTDLSVLSIERLDKTIRLELWYPEGLVGQIDASTVRVSISPGEPRVE